MFNKLRITIENKFDEAKFQEFDKQRFKIVIEGEVNEEFLGTLIELIQKESPESLPEQVSIVCNNK